MRLQPVLFFVVLFSTLPCVSSAVPIDSAKWPFPDSIDVSAQMWGQFHSYLNQPGNPQNFDATRCSRANEPTINEFTAVFGRKDIVSADGENWTFAKSNNPQLDPNHFVLNMSLVLNLDTTRHKILLLDYNYTVKYKFDYLERSEITLKDLEYNRGTITARDHDLRRHVLGTDYRTTGPDYTGNELIRLDTLNIFGQTFTRTFEPPQSVDFGTMSLTVAKDTTIVLRNNNNIPLNVFHYSLFDSTAGFSILDTSLHVIPPHDSATISVRFLPAERKVYSGLLTISTDEPYSYQIALAGSALRQATVLEGRTIDPLSMASIVKPNGIALVLKSRQTFSNVTIEFYDEAGKTLFVQNIGTLPSGLNEVTAIQDARFAQVFEASRVIGFARIPISK